METARGRPFKPRVKQDAGCIFRELTRSICPECKTVIDAQVIILGVPIAQDDRFLADLAKLNPLI